ncbi:MAG: bifunctional aspartate kinase/homoserine dehydrogenase I, partial [Bacteroidales bacterium]|nr:bifunctional aspartate kinase/homoserine dehydrogenase I [Bacteroidales bacterium]
MKVMKFGGTSVGSPETIRVVQKIVESQTEPCAVVVSAFGGITDKIISISRKAMEHDPSYKDDLFEFSNRHFDAINELLEDDNREHTLKEADAMINEFQDILHGVYLLEDLSDKTMGFLLSFGERLSAKILSRLIQKAAYIDARKMIRTNSNYLNATV